MSQAFLGEIRCFGFGFAPYQWAQCTGQLVSVSQYTALFSLLGTNFGGNGTTNFGLPNLLSHAPMHWGSPPALSPTNIGETQGSAEITLQAANMPMHNHLVTTAETVTGGDSQRVATPTSNTYLGESSVPNDFYRKAASSPVVNTQFAPNAISPAFGTSGGAIPHDNVQPYLAVNFCIALAGVFPARN